MACPKCGCKVTYIYDPYCDSMGTDDEMDRCSACGHIFYPYIEGDDDDY